MVREAHTKRDMPAQRPEGDEEASHAVTWLYRRKKQGVQRSWGGCVLMVLYSVWNKGELRKVTEAGGPFQTILRT